MKNQYLATLKNTRRQKKYSQAYMAVKLGVTQKAYSKIEKGETLLKQNVILKLSEILEVSPDLFCAISGSCSKSSSSCNAKNQKLLQLLKSNNIEIPKDLE